jgi:hypothetical protein
MQDILEEFLCVMPSILDYDETPSRLGTSLDDSQVSNASHTSRRHEKYNRKIEEWQSRLSGALKEIRILKTLTSENILPKIVHENAENTDFLENKVKDQDQQIEFMRLESIHANSYIESTTKKLELQSSELRQLKNLNREIQAELTHQESEAN